MRFKELVAHVSEWVVLPKDSLVELSLWKEK